MDSARFDRLTSIFELSTRRGAMRVLAAALGLGGLAVLRPDETRAKRKGKRRKKNRGGGAGKGLRQSCKPGQNSCSAGLKCDTPTTRHTCSSTVQGVSTWCCVPPGGSCTECDCCGDHYCEFDNNNQPHCVPNPEG